MFMRACVISGEGPIGAAVRLILLRQGYECPADHLFPLRLAADKRLESGIELAVVVLSPDSERALAALAAVRQRVRGHVLGVGPASEPKLILRALRGRGG